MYGNEQQEKLRMKVSELNEFVNKLYDKRKKQDELKAELKELTAGIESDKRMLLEFFDQEDMEKFVHERGTISVINKFSVKIPKDEESKKALFNWLRKKKIHMQYLTVSSTALNSLYKTELEATGPEFKMPGVAEPQLFQQISMRSK